MFTIVMIDISKQSLGTSSHIVNGFV